MVPRMPTVVGVRLGWWALWEGVVDMMFFGEDIGWGLRDGHGCRIAVKVFLWDGMIKEEEEEEEFVV